MLKPIKLDELTFIAHFDRPVPIKDYYDVISFGGYDITLNDQDEPVMIDFTSMAFENKSNKNTCLYVSAHELDDIDLVELNTNYTKQYIDINNIDSIINMSYDFSSFYDHLEKPNLLKITNIVFKGYDNGKEVLLEMPDFLPNKKY